MSLNVDTRHDEKANSATPPSDWFYEASGSRQGPISLDELRKLLISKEINDATLVWRPSFGTSWRPLLEAGVHEHRKDIPPALPAGSVTDFYVWLVSLTPIIGTFVEQYLRSAYTHFRPSDTMIFGAYFLFSTVLIGADSSAITKSGRSEANPGFWFWLVPAYLTARARALRRGWLFPIVWLTALVGSMYIEDPDLFKKDMYWGFGLPVCDSTFTKGQLSSIVNESEQFQSANTTILRFSGLKETARSDNKRSCAGNFQTNRLVNFTIDYTISDGSDDQIYIEAQFQAQ